LTLYSLKRIMGSNWEFVKQWRMIEHE